MKGGKRRFQLRIERTLFDDAKRMAKKKKVTITSIVEEGLRHVVGAYKMEQYAELASRAEDAEQI